MRVSAAGEWWETLYRCASIETTPKFVQRQQVYMHQSRDPESLVSVCSSFMTMLLFNYTITVLTYLTTDSLAFFQGCWRGEEIMWEFPSL